MTATIAVLIPTLGRPEHLQPLLDNIRDTATVPQRAYLIAEAADTATTRTLPRLKGSHAAIVGTFGSCAKAMNAGYDASHEPYIFTGNDDLRFHPGWDTAALQAIEGHGACGTNDGHGRMTCFALVRRQFIEDHSGVYDQPGTLMHPYASQYPDTELAEYARHRGQWTQAPDAITEHIHHEFGKADPSHPNYIKARETCAADHAQYQARKQAWQQQEPSR